MDGSQWNTYLRWLTDKINNLKVGSISFFLSDVIKFLFLFFLNQSNQSSAIKWCVTSIIHSCNYRNLCIICLPIPAHLYIYHKYPCHCNYKLYFVAFTFVFFVPLLFTPNLRRGCSSYFRNSSTTSTSATSTTVSPYCNGTTYSHWTWRLCKMIPRFWWLKMFIK